jgi:hypothetical protein
LTEIERQTLLDWAQMARLSYHIDEPLEWVDAEWINKYIA